MTEKELVERLSGIAEQLEQLANEAAPFGYSIEVASLSAENFGGKNRQNFTVTGTKTFHCPNPPKGTIGHIPEVT